MRHVSGKEDWDWDGTSGAVKIMRIGGGVVAIWQKSELVGHGTEYWWSIIISREGCS